LSDDTKILNWFGKRKESLVTAGMHSHALAVLDCVTELGAALRAMSEGDTATASKCINRLIVNEHEADALEDRLCEQLSLGDVGPQEREDLLHFVRKTDSIANWCKEAAIYIQLIIETGVKVPQSVWSMARSISSDLESEVNYLMSCIKVMITGKDDIHACIEGVKAQEHKIDMSYIDITKEIYLQTEDAKAIMLTTKVVEAMEMAADTGKGCADTISILMVARRIRWRHPWETDGSGVSSTRTSPSSWRCR
jgi:hypothetical protein